MQEVTFIFVNAQDSPLDNFLGWLITSFEHTLDAKFASHVAIQFNNLEGYGPKILEATADGVVLSDYNEYDNVKLQCRVTISLTEEQYQNFQQKALEIISEKYKYSYKADLVGGIADSFSRKLAKSLAKLLKMNTIKEMDCSETATVLIRTVYPKFCGNLDSSEITPYAFYIQLLIDSIFKFITITNIIRYGVSYK